MSNRNLLWRFFAPQKNPRDLSLSLAAANTVRQILPLQKQNELPVMSKCPTIWTRSHVKKNRFRKFSGTKSTAARGLKHVPGTFPRHHNGWPSLITIMEDAHIYEIADQYPEQQSEGNMTWMHTCKGRGRSVNKQEGKTKDLQLVTQVIVIPVFCLWTNCLVWSRMEESSR